MIEFAIFRSKKQRYAFMPIKKCERCNCQRSEGGDEVAPRYSQSAGKVLTLCGKCSH